MPGLEEFGITPRRATRRELEEALVSVQTQIASPMVKTLLCHIAEITKERDQLASRLGEGTALAVARAVQKHNCSNTMAMQVERVEHFVRRMGERDDDPDDILIVLINVDSCAFARSLGDALMPGCDWQAFRARGEMPFARGLASREGVQDALGEFDPEAASKLEALDGRVAVVVFDHGVAEVFEPSSGARTA